MCRIIPDRNLANPTFSGHQIVLAMPCRDSNRSEIGTFEIIYMDFDQLLDSSGGMMQGDQEFEDFASLEDATYVEQLFAAHFRLTIRLKGLCLTVIAKLEKRSLGSDTRYVTKNGHFNLV